MPTATVIRTTLRGEVLPSVTVKRFIYSKKKIKNNIY
jgi:hypothetical protein